MCVITKGPLRDAGLHSCGQDWNGGLFIEATGLTPDVAACEISGYPWERTSKKRPSPGAALP